MSDKNTLTESNVGKKGFAWAYSSRGRESMVKSWQQEGKVPWQEKGFSRSQFVCRGRNGIGSGEGLYSLKATLVMYCLQ